MALDIAMILKLAPLATAQLKKYRRGNLSRSLDRRVQAELENDPALPPGVTDSLLYQWLYVHNDPRGAVVIAGLLRHGDVAYLEALRVRATEVLSGLELLPLGVSATVDRLVAAVGNNFVGAQKDESEAVQTSTSAVLSAISRWYDARISMMWCCALSVRLRPRSRECCCSLAASTRHSSDT